MFNTNVFLLTFINNKSLSIVQVLNGRSLILEYYTHTLAKSVTLSIYHKNFTTMWNIVSTVICRIITHRYTVESTTVTRICKHQTTLCARIDNNMTELSHICVQHFCMVESTLI